MDLGITRKPSKLRVAKRLPQQFTDAAGEPPLRQLVARPRMVKPDWAIGRVGRQQLPEVQHPHAIPATKSTAPDRPQNPANTKAKMN